MRKRPTFFYLNAAQQAKRALPETHNPAPPFIRDSLVHDPIFSRTLLRSALGPDDTPHPRCPSGRSIFVFQVLFDLPPLLIREVVKAVVQEVQACLGG